MLRKFKFPFPAINRVLALILLFAAVLPASCAREKSIPDAIYYNGKIVTVDSAFTIAQAVAIKGDRFLAVGTDKEILSLAGEKTKRMDLEGATVVPGLIEAHAHPEDASLSELENPLPNPRTVDELLAWIEKQAQLKPDGEWIIHPVLFSTRLRELRAPTLAELDRVAPHNPVFLDGSYGGSINSAAMRASGITQATKHPGLLRDPKTGKLNGKLRFTAFSLLKLPPEKKFTLQQRAEALKHMFSLYNRVGFTSFTSGALTLEDTLLYHYMKSQGMLSIRAFLNILVPFPFKELKLEELRAKVAAMGPPTGSGDEWVRIGALKTFADGGILTGTAYLRQPWGPKAAEIYGVTDPTYRGILRFTAEEFAPLVQAGAEAGWKMTAHCTGGGAVDVVLKAYEKVNQTLDVRPLRFSIIHGNFYNQQAIKLASRLNVIADMQPAWFYKDADAMLYILGEERIRTFHPYRSLIEGGVVVSAGSDHMVILDDKESINPYNPWLAMWCMITRKTERGTVIIPEEAISREQALRCYTINNAYASFEEKIKGSIEPGKLADMVVLNQDYLTCPVDSIKNITVKMTLVGGKVVFDSSI